MTTGCLFGSAERLKYNRRFLDAFLRNRDFEFLWCHDPKLDREPNGMIPLLEMLKGSNIRWVRDSARRQLGHVDAAITDVGSAFFFEAINEGKPILCLQQRHPSVDLGKAKEHFGECVQTFDDYDPTEKLDVFLENLRQKRANWYMPTKYLWMERERPNDKLIWEER